MQLRCKGCGTIIANLRNRRLERSGSYMEAKLLFTDGSFHVTHGCSACLSQKLTPTDIEAIARADLGRDNRTGLKVVQRDATKSGIV